MSSFTTLWWWDVQKSKGWLSVETIAKVLLMAAFILIFLGLSLGFYFFSYGLFAFLVDREVFGLLTAEYIWSMLLIVVASLGIITSAFSGYQTYFKLEQLSSLLPHPIPLKTIFWYKALGNAFQSLWPFLLLLVPVWAAFARAQEQSVFTTSFLLASALLLFLAHSFGNLLAFGVGYLVSRLGKTVASWLIVSVFVLGAFLSVQVLLPVSLRDIYAAPDEASFTARITEQPVMSQLILTNWIRPLLTKSTLEPNSVALIFIILAAYTLLVRLVNKNYWQLLQVNFAKSSNASAHRNTTFPRVQSRELSVVINDLLAVFSSSSERNYFLFISVVLGVLLAISYQMPIQKAAEQGWLLGAFGVFWFSFFSLIILFANKFVFPLFIKEFRSPQILLMAPISPKKILQTKLLSGFLITSTPAIIGGLVLLNNGFYIDNVLVWALSISALVVLITTIQCLSGLFVEKRRDDAFDQTGSTNLAGLLATGITFAVVFFSLVRLLVYSAETAVNFLIAAVYLSVAFLLQVLAGRFIHKILL